MVDRNVTYNLKVEAYKGNQKELAAFLKSIKSTYAAADKEVLRSVANRTKAAQQASKLEEKEAKRAGEAAKRAIRERERDAKRLAATEISEAKRAGQAASREIARQVAEGKRAARERLADIAQKERESKRAAASISRDAQRRDREMERSARRVWDSTRTAVEKHNERVAKLKDLLRDNRISQETYTTAVGKSEEAMRNAGRTFMDAFGENAMRRIATMVAGFATIREAITILKDEYQAWLDKLERAKMRVMTTGELEEQLKINLNAKTVQEQQYALTQTAKMGKDLGVGYDAALRTMILGTATRGTYSVDEALRAGRAGLEFRKGDPYAAGQLAAGGLAIRRATGGKATAEAGIGLIVAGQQFARQTDIGEIAKGITPGVNAAGLAGATPQQVMAIYGVLSQALGREHGEMAGTATTNVLNVATETFRKVAEQQVTETQKNIEKASKPVRGAELALGAARESLAGLQAPESPQLAKEIAYQKELLTTTGRKAMPPAAKERKIGQIRATIAKLEAQRGPLTLTQQQEIYDAEQEVRKRQEELADLQKQRANLPALQKELARREESLRIAREEPDFMKRVERIRSDQQLAAAVSEKAEGRRVVKGAIGSFFGVKGITGTERKVNVPEQYAQTLAGLPSATEAGPAYYNALEVQKRGGLRQANDLLRQFTSMNDELEFINQAQGVLGGARDMVQQAVEDVGGSRTAARLEKFVAGSDYGMLANILKRQRAQLVSPYKYQFDSPYMFGPRGGQVPEAPSAIDTQQAEVLNRMIALLEALGEGQRQGLEINSEEMIQRLDQMNDTLRDIRAQGSRPSLPQAQPQALPMGRNSGM